MPNGLVDLVIKKDGHYEEVDVKTLQVGNRGPVFAWNNYLSEEQLERGVRILFVSVDGTVGWNRDYF